MGCPPLKDLEICNDNEDLCDAFNMDEIGLTFEDSDEIFGCSQSNSSLLFEDSDEIFGCSQSNSSLLFEDEGMDCLFPNSNLLNEGIIEGHDILMATILNGAAIMDGALLLIAGNESCPQPQTSEYIAVIEIMRLQRIIILQNKIDLIQESVAIN